MNWEEKRDKGERNGEENGLGGRRGGKGRQGGEGTGREVINNEEYARAERREEPRKSTKADKNQANRKVIMESIKKRLK